MPLECVEENSLLAIAAAVAALRAAAKLLVQLKSEYLQGQRAIRIPLLRIHTI